ncbi:S8 family serine peptidase [Candidatus Poribacteria bacterium]|nr:S8 family serine peptidase [Candidatus Poribacteria bacterium]
MIKNIIILIFSLIFIYGCSEIIIPRNPAYRFIVAFDGNENMDKIYDELKEIDIDVIDKLYIISAVSCYLNEDQKDHILSLPYTRYIEPDYELFMLDVNFPSVAFISKYEINISDEVTDWGVRYIKAPEVWDITTGKGIRIGVIDTGITPDHPDLQGCIAGGYNAIDGGRYEDDNDHGTYISSIIAGRKNNSGIIGVAPDAEIYAIKVMNNQGRGFISNVIEGCQWAAEEGIKIVNLSLGADFESISIKEAISYMTEKGIITVAAAGNEGKNVIYSPARESVALCVGGAGMNGDRASWSNYGNEMKISGVLAPGDFILVGEKSGGWRRVSGTSVAAPHVTGLFALLMELNSDSGFSLRDYVIAGASNHSNPDEYIGYGMINALKSVNLMLKEDAYRAR